MSDGAVFVYVEDDAPSRMVMEMMLVNELRYPYLTMFENSEDIIAQIEALSPAPTVFFLDIHVQPHNGFEILKMLREHPTFQNAIVIAMTASVMHEEVQTLKTAGFDSVVPKPMNQDTFPDMLDRILGGEKFWRVL